MAWVVLLINPSWACARVPSSVSRLNVWYSLSCTFPLVCRLMMSEMVSRILSCDRSVPRSRFLTTRSTLTWGNSLPVTTWYTHTQKINEVCLHTLGRFTFLSVSWNSTGEEPPRERERWDYLSTFLEVDPKFWWLYDRPHLQQEVDIEM